MTLRVMPWQSLSSLDNPFAVDLLTYQGANRYVGGRTAGRTTKNGKPLTIIYHAESFSVYGRRGWSRYTFGKDLMWVERKTLCIHSNLQTVRRPFEHYEPTGTQDGHSSLHPT